jgi:DNA-binding response OmpR family regulator
MRKKVLIVDDNAELLGLLRLSFRAAGFSIATATNGIEALRKARSVSPDLILLDLVLPELDGFAVCETLRRAPATSSIPIFILSGLTSEFTRLAGIESGATEYFPKPVSPKQLVSRIKETFGNLPSAAHVSKPVRRSHPARCSAARSE